MVHIRVRDEQAASAKWCPKKDQAGNDLQDSRFPKAFAVTCTYKTGVVCTYTGSLVPLTVHLEDGSGPSCPGHKPNFAASASGAAPPPPPPPTGTPSLATTTGSPQPDNPPPEKPGVPSTSTVTLFSIQRLATTTVLNQPPSASPSTAHPDAVVSQNATPSPAGNAALSGKQKAPIGAIIGGILGPLFLLLLLAAGLLWWRRKQRKQESEWRRYPPPAPSFHTYTYTGTESDFIRSHSELLHSHASAVENLPGPPPSYASHPASARPGRVRSASTYSYPFAGDWREDANNLKRAATTREKERELQFVYE